MELGWISVDDRLPEDLRLNVIRYGKDGRHIGIELSHYNIPSNMNKNMWAFEFGNRQGTKVTHWMPLPKPPEDK